MARRINFFLFIALISIFEQTISLNSKTNEQKCAHANFWCNSSLLQPCCDVNNQCVQFSVGVSQCIKEEPQEFKSGLINSSCTVDQDCRHLLNAECSNDKQCVCKPKNIYQNNKCLPILGGFCWHNHQSCATVYSECINFKCQCKNGYSQYSDNQCMLNIIGENCEDDKFCSQVKFAKCTKSKKCDCLFNTTAIDKIRCLSILNGICFKNSDCFSQNSHCVNNKCQCTPGFIAVSNIKCVENFLGSKCKNDSDCIKINHSECSIKKVCSCKHNYVQFNEKTCGIPIWGACSNNEDCTVINSRCKNHVCQCKLGSVSKSPNYTVCTRRLERFCVTNEHCSADNSVCIDHVCQYNSSCKRQLDDESKRNLGQNCTTDQECLHNLHAKCSIENICVCEENYYEFNETLCMSLLGGFCSHDEDCLVDNSYCREGECQCKLHYELFSNYECQALYLNQACKYNTDCNKIENSICSKDKKCVCQANHSAFGVNQCLAHIGQFCINNDDCVSNSVTVCIHNKCQCIDKFIPLQSKDNCVSVILGAPCKFHKDCDSIENAKCSENNICVCRTNYYVLDEFSCGPSINEACWDDDDCMVHSSVCIDNHCQCQSNFSAVSSLQCVKSDLLFSCRVDADCGDPWHSKCLENKKCGCNTKSILIDKSTCLPLIGGLCWADTQCITIRNSSCVDYHCKCNSNTRLIADNMCPQNLFSRSINL